ncbi:lysylphosphatidylglycerol synthase domain-containing protein [Actinoplanes sp. RD1]|uniref:lysylphosphatidylglycerol synthase domain-containing protein n=1 Tax=Actinoplanes sp. RD1 TaxID=3064538 RepID=UPI0027429679|nr:lysylphosphatidylglycerol synthase domain-containing protein [Actinoplanes sp. RD1]
MTGTRQRAVRAVLAAAFGVALLAGVVVALRSENWDTIRETVLRGAALPYAAAAFAANVAGLGLALASWHVLIVDGGHRVRLPLSGTMFAAGLLGKYIPGRVWGVLAQIQLGRSAGLTPARIGSSYVASLAVSVLAGTTVGLLAAPAVLGGQGGWLVLPALLCLAWFVWPQGINRLAALAARVLRRPGVPARLSHRGIRRSLAFSAASWLVSGLHLWFLALLFGAPALRSLPLCAGGFALAMVVGSVALIVPDGWGIRELVLTVPLATVLPLPAAIAVAVASRVVILASELAAAGVVYLTYRIRRGSPAPAPAPLIEEETQAWTR